MKEKVNVFFENKTPGDWSNLKWGGVFHANCDKIIINPSCSFM